MSEANTAFYKWEDTIPVVWFDASATHSTPQQTVKTIKWERVYEQEQKLHAPRNRHERRAEAARQRRGIT